MQLLCERIICNAASDEKMHGLDYTPFEDLEMTLNSFLRAALIVLFYCVRLTLKILFSADFLTRR